jgi:tRNA (guanine-N7-)-methyltransferase
MFANSNQVDSTQTTPHPRLREIVLKHLENPYLRRPSDVGRKAFASIADQLSPSPFILDAGCGTGASTLALARKFPDRLVLGVDKSIARLTIGRRVIDSGGAPANLRLLHCELVDFWQLAEAAELRCEKQFLLYPNPWPKPEYLMRRWHAHPVLPAILALGGKIELRTNWGVYAGEFADAMSVAGMDAPSGAYTPDAALTPFERKYVASGHALWRVETCVSNAR